MLQVEVVMKHTTLWSLLLAALVVGVLPACSAGPTARPQPASGDDDDSEDDCACSNSNFLTQSACEAAGHTWSCGGDDDTSGDDDSASDDDTAGDDDRAGRGCDCSVSGGSNSAASVMLLFSCWLLAIRQRRRA